MLTATSSLSPHPLSPRASPPGREGGRGRRAVVEEGRNRRVGGWVCPLKSPERRVCEKCMALIKGEIPPRLDFYIRGLPPHKTVIGCVIFLH